MVNQKQRNKAKVLGESNGRMNEVQVKAGPVNESPLVPWLDRIVNAANQTNKETPIPGVDFFGFYADEPSSSSSCSAAGSDEAKGDYVMLIFQYLDTEVRVGLSFNWNDPTQPPEFTFNKNLSKTLPLLYRIDLDEVFDDQYFQWDVSAEKVLVHLLASVLRVYRTMLFATVSVIKPRQHGQGVRVSLQAVVSKYSQKVEFKQNSDAGRPGMRFELVAVQHNEKHPDKPDVHVEVSIKLEAVHKFPSINCSNRAQYYELIAAKADVIVTAVYVRMGEGGIRPPSYRASPLLTALDPFLALLDCIWIISAAMNKDSYAFLPPAGHNETVYLDAFLDEMYRSCNTTVLNVMKSVKAKSQAVCSLREFFATNKGFGSVISCDMEYFTDARFHVTFDGQPYKLHVLFPAVFPVNSVTFRLFGPGAERTLLAETEQQMRLHHYRTEDVMGVFLKEIMEDLLMKVPVAMQ